MFIRNVYLFVSELTVILVVTLLLQGIFRNWRIRRSGHEGERYVAKKLSELDSAHYKVLADLLLPSNGRSQTAQIDHVVISNFGIFCIETKAHKGWISGDASEQYWTKTKYRRKYPFYNPLLQNRGHIQAIQSLVQPRFPKTAIYSFVAFPFADKLFIKGTSAVGTTQDIEDKIKSHTTTILTDAERDEIYRLLQQANILDASARKRHDQVVKDINK